jgi:hypothetical protein
VIASASGGVFNGLIVFRRRIGTRTTRSGSWRDVRRTGLIVSGRMFGTGTTRSGSGEDVRRTGFIVSGRRFGTETTKSGKTGSGSGLASRTSLRIIRIACLAGTSVRTKGDRSVRVFIFSRIIAD